MEKNTGYNPDVAKYREGFLKPERDTVKHSYEHMFMVGMEGINIFTTLSNNEAFLTEAAAAEEQLQANPASLPSLTKKYSYLIKPTK